MLLPGTKSLMLNLMLNHRKTHHKKDRSRSFSVCICFSHQTVTETSITGFPNTSRKPKSVDLELLWDFTTVTRTLVNRFLSQNSELYSVYSHLHWHLSQNSVIASFFLVFTFCSPEFHKISYAYRTAPNSPEHFLSQMQILIYPTHLNNIQYPFFGGLQIFTHSLFHSKLVTQYHTEIYNKVIKRAHHEEVSCLLKVSWNGQMINYHFPYSFHKDMWVEKIGKK